MHDFETTDGVLFDLDGTLISGGRVLPWTDRLIKASRGQFAIVTNDAEHTTSEIAALMGRIGFPVDEGRIVTAGMEAIRLVAAEKPQARILMVASDALKAYARTLGLYCCADRSDVVLIGRDRAFSYDKIAAAANAVLSGAQLVICNPDRTHPGPGGAIVPESGALAASILACTGPVPHRIVGKPEPAIFKAGMAILGTAANRTLMVGDNPETDGKGAIGVGIRFLDVASTLAMDTQRF
ncbi:HAD-IIA family hydrolase [Rhizobium oryzicola]|uniref:HAD hydrolase-like protein n=1 Tax=Rhizobium oryzicola TaxID=1232668 RepID=A0ABT8T508_9HYPH|nr:HAD family hydrolase [Rhizobium oryzicola]MDO1585515.1 HAD hydrolase-like protein [Rhizobium oryzicola]